MAKIDQNYHKLLNEILCDGFRYEDPNRKGVYRVQIPSYTFKHKFSDGFPAITTKKLYWKGVVGELLWFLKGDTNIKYLLKNNIRIWDKDAYNHFLKTKPELEKCSGPNDCKNIPFERDNQVHMDLFLGETLEGNSGTGDLGRIYGAQWRKWYSHTEREYDSRDNCSYDTKVYVDQFSNLIKGLKENPMGTEHIVTAWNPAELKNMALPPCHWSFEILVKPLRSFERLDLIGGYVSTDDLKSEETEHQIADVYKVPRYGFTLKWHQRSVDTFLGLPFNIASYALLANIIGKIANMTPIGIEGDLSNVHIYEPHVDAVMQQLNRSVGTYSKSELTMLDEFHYVTDKELVGDVPVETILNELRVDMFKLKGYKSYPAIKAEMLAYNK